METLINECFSRHFQHHNSIHSLIIAAENGDEYFTDKYNHYSFYTGHDFLELGRRLGLPEKPVQNFINKLKDSQQEITDLIQHSYMPDEMKARAVELIKSQINILQIVKMEN